MQHGQRTWPDIAALRNEMRREETDSARESKLAGCFEQTSPESECSQTHKRYCWRLRLPLLLMLMLALLLLDPALPSCSSQIRSRCKALSTTKRMILSSINGGLRRS